MGQKFTVKQNDFSHGMQSETRDKKLVGASQVFGASKIKHFDIYQNANKLIPQPSFERFNTDAEKDYGIVAVGGDISSNLYGLGKSINNWYSLDYQYKITLTPDSTGSVDYIFIDLSELSDNFWDNVNIDGSDIRARLDDDDFPVSKLIDFNRYDKVGFLLVQSRTIQNVDIYFGFDDSTLFSTYEGLFSTRLEHAFPLDGVVVDYISGEDLTEGTTNFTTGKFGQAITDSSSRSDNQVTSGDEGSISFLVKLDALPSTEDLLIQFGDMQVYVRSDGKLRLLGDLTTGSVTLTTVSSLTLGQWHYIGMNINDFDYANIFIDGVEDVTTSISSDLDGSALDILISPNEDTNIQSVMLQRSTTKTDAQCVSEGLMFTTTDFWTEGTLENISSITPTYSGIGIYTKDINDSEWKTDYYSGLPVADNRIDIFPLPAFIENDSGYFFLSSADENLQSFIYGGRAAFFDVTNQQMDALDTLLGFRSSGLPLASLSFPIDKEWYWNNSGSLDNYTGGTFNSNVFDSYPVLNSHTPYGYSLAMTGSRRSQGYIEIWDLTNLDPETVIKTGGGINRVITNTKGQLIIAVDNYIQDEALSRGEASLDFKQWLGNDNIKTLQSFPFANVDTVYDNDWQTTISSRRSDVENASVFYAEPKNDWTGFWSIGAGAKLINPAIAIMFDTELIGRPTYNHSIGNNLIVINEDLEMYKLNNDGVYNQSSLFESMTINAGVTGVKKDINAIEVVLDNDLEIGQTVTVSYSVDGGDFELVGTCDNKVTEFTSANGDSFNNFNELVIRIESIGGSASVIEYSVRGEYEEEVI